MQEFAGKVAVITGAAAGMGFEYARRFAAEGMKLVLADINAAELDKATTSMRDGGADVIGVATDVSSAESVNALAAQAFAKYGTAHVLCNNAGVVGYLDGPIWEANSNDWGWTFGVNLWGVLNGVLAFLPRMIEQNEGHIVNTASAAAFTMPSTMYSLSKQAVVGLSELIYAELAYRESNVHVTLLCPGEVKTNAPRNVGSRPATFATQQDVSHQDFGAMIREQMAKRWDERGAKSPESVADLVVNAIKTEQFYLFTDNAWDAQIETRNRHVLQRQNPSLPQDPVGLAIAAATRQAIDSGKR